MTKTGVIRCLLSIVLLGYLAFAMLVSCDMASRQTCRGVEVIVDRMTDSRSFLSVNEVHRLIREWGIHWENRAFSDLDIQDLEDRLNAVTNIESANVEKLANNRLRINVTPMIPVARIFDGNSSYYINRSGKRLTANARCRLDVPIICGSFDSLHSPAALLPMVERISNDSAWNALVAQIIVSPRNRDIILVPMIRGHVINMGDTSNIDNKLERVMAMYHKVLPLKGWNFYDTISVKWGGQVVATRRLKEIPQPYIRFDQEGDITDDEDVNSMLTDTIAGV